MDQTKNVQVALKMDSRSLYQFRKRYATYGKALSGLKRVLILFNMADSYTNAFYTITNAYIHFFLHCQTI